LCRLLCRLVYPRGRHAPELLDRIIREGEELGTYLYTILGGEPFVYPHLFEVAKNHPDVVFHTFTNGTLLTNPKMIEQLKEVGNIVPVISIEGWEKETDQRRGAGMFANIVKVMDTLKANGIPSVYRLLIPASMLTQLPPMSFMIFLSTRERCLDGISCSCRRQRPDTSLMPRLSNVRTLRNCSAR